MCVGRSSLVICSETFTLLSYNRVDYIFFFSFLDKKKGLFLFLLSLHVKSIIQLSAGSCRGNFLFGAQSRLSWTERMKFRMLKPGIRGG